jgi:hypothetical protein
MIQGFSGGLLNRELIYNLDLPSFQRDFASLKTLDHGTGPAITFTRASGATYFDANGELQTAAEDEPRFDHSQDGAARSLGLLIEEQRTNSIRNSQAGGAVVGAPGTLPTNWVIAIQTGLSQEIVATGTVNGMTYIDIRISGTAANTNANAIATESATGVAALQDQTWTISTSVALVGGTLTNVANVGIGFVERDAGAVALVSGVLTGFTPTATLTRYVGTRALTNAATAFYQPTVRFAAQDTVTPIDLTLRIAAPQLELGAFPTSYIPTTTAAATRSVDVAVVESPNFAGSYNNEESTLLGEYIFGNSVPSIRMLQLDNGTNAERLCLALTSSSTPQNFAQTGGGTTLSSTPATGEITVGAIYKTGAAFAANNMIAASNGTLGILDSSGAMPAGPLGQLTVSGTTARGHWIRKIAYYPKRLTNALLEQLTT